MRIATYRVLFCGVFSLFFAFGSVPGQAQTEGETTPTPVSQTATLPTADDQANLQQNTRWRVFLPLVQQVATVPTPPPPSATPVPSPRPNPSPQPTPPAPSGEVRTGRGTFYAATGDGNCMFGPSPNDLMVAAMNQIDYANSAICGAFVEITGPRGVVTVRITDRCPECPKGDIDLSREAFARIADPVQGIVPISWRIVSTDISGPIAYRFKDGSNQWWTAVQIRNHRNPIAKFEYQLPNGQFREVPRFEYNHFVAEQGMGPGPYTFRVTDIYGNVLSDSNIPLRAEAQFNGAGQFPKR
ncbi:MAG: hypothetical protein MUD01_02240 [Chloroflexaceae bacterium]|jgi:expansin (peptidoglycan-binding protein)|nr:hypothetical protein [Chloroflexaceae bacterium]